MRLAAMQIGQFLLKLHERVMVPAMCGCHRRRCPFWWRFQPSRLPTFGCCPIPR